MADLTPARPARRPLTSRKLDMLYLVFFIIHTPVMFLVDLSSIMPSFLKTSLSSNMVAYHIERFQDQFFTSPPAWFTLYMWVELFYQVPLTLWMLWGILNDHPLVPLNLLVFGVDVAVSTATCIADISEWKTYTSAQKNDLYTLYVPYLVLSSLMGFDAFFRVKRQVLHGPQGSTKAKTG